MSRGVEVVPNARRVIDSLRSLGYDFSTAVADVVDNSIEARATTIQIEVEFRGADSRVMIADNGCGMNYHQLQEAMRFGTDREYGQKSLGKFGLGMKTASLSQCRRLLVASRCNLDTTDIHAFSWDLDHVAETQGWYIKPVHPRELPPEVMERLRDTTGTVVTWLALERILTAYQDPEGGWAERGLLKMIEELERHLRMVHHQYLERGEDDGGVRIILNGNPLQPWDPFARSEPATRPGNLKTIHLKTAGVEGDIVVMPFVLPRESDFSSPEARKEAAGSKGWNAQQGLYIYREARLIQSGGWSGLRAPDEHTKLARVALSFSPDLDRAFEINVAKMTVQIPDEIRKELADITGSVCREAREVYDNKLQAGSRLAVPSTHGGTGSGSGDIGQTAIGSPSGTETSGQTRPTGGEPRIQSLGPVPIGQGQGRATATGGTRPGLDSGTALSPSSKSMERTLQELFQMARQGERPTVERVIRRFCVKHGINFNLVHGNLTESDD